MDRMTKRRFAGGATALMLIGATLLATAGSTIAATTRLIYVGADPAFVTGNGTITFTPVSAGQQTASVIYVKNIDNQTLNHVVLTFPLDQGNGTTVGTTAYGLDGGKCARSGTDLVCDYGQLKAGATKTFTIVLTAGSSGAIAGTVVYNESNNPNGGNVQINDVTGTLSVAAASCNSLAAFLPPGQAKSFLPFDSTTCSADGQRSGLDVPSSANGSVVTIDDATAATANSCGSFVCFGNVVSASVNNGAPVDPYLRWVIFYDNATLGNINPRQVAFLHGTTVIPAGNKGLCKTASSTNCQEPYIVSSTGVTFFVRTPTNALIKGMH